MSTSYIKKSYDFLGDFVTAVKDTPWPEAVAKALPWTGYVGEAVADTVAPVKFVLKLYENATRQDDPNELGMIACTAAFQRSVEQAFTRFPPENDKNTDTGALPSLEFTDDYSFETFSYKDALEHPFYRESRKILEHALNHLDVDDTRRRRIADFVDRRFVANLQFVLASGETAEKFKPFLTLVVAGGVSQALRSTRTARGLSTLAIRIKACFRKSIFSRPHLRRN